MRLAVRLDPAALLEAAQAATGGSWEALAAVLRVDSSTLRRWRSGDRAMPGPAVQLCRALVAWPELAEALEHLADGPALGGRP